MTSIIQEKIDAYKHREAISNAMFIAFSGLFAPLLTLSSVIIVKPIDSTRYFAFFMAIVLLLVASFLRIISFDPGNKIFLNKTAYFFLLVSILFIGLYLFPFNRSADKMIRMPIVLTSENYYAIPEDAEDIKFTRTIGDNKLLVQYSIDLDL